MGIAIQAKARRVRQLIALTLLAELKTKQPNLLRLMLDKSTLWAEDRQALRLPPLAPETQARLAKKGSQGRLLRLREAIFIPATPSKKESKQLVYKNDVYQARLPVQVKKP